MDDPEEKKERWRVFCALELPVEVRARVGARIEELRRAAADARARWESPEKLHITLKFIGEVEPARSAALVRATARTAASVGPFTLELSGAGAFPPRGRPQVLWLGVGGGSQELLALQRRLEEECAREGFARDARPFHPHVTIARLRPHTDARSLARAHRDGGFAARAFTAAEVVVIRSELGPGGSRYTTLARCALGRAAEEE